MVSFLWMCNIDNMNCENVGGEEAHITEIHVFQTVVLGLIPSTSSSIKGVTMIPKHHWVEPKNKNKYYKYLF